MAIFHVLSCFRNLTWSQQAARTGDPDTWMHAFTHVTDTAYNPRGHSLGIIGLGAIGFLIGKKAHRAFGMNILYNDLYRKPADMEEQLGSPTFYADLDAMISVADCVVVASSFTGNVLIDAQRLSKFKQGARLVNIARGPLVDETALADALEEHRIAAVGLDVFEDEPRINPRLIRNEKYVTLTCHNAGDTVETHVGFEKISMENVARVLKGEEPLSAVNKHLFR
jgi:lactate dehydrogenase-like 2-hydroxyacid dehydrogenase